MVLAAGDGRHLAQLARSLVRASKLSRSLGSGQIRRAPPVPCRLTPVVSHPIDPTSRGVESRWRPRVPPRWTTWRSVREFVVWVRLRLQAFDLRSPENEATLETKGFRAERDQVGLLYFGARVRVHRDDVFLGGGEN